MCLLRVLHIHINGFTFFFDAYDVKVGKMLGIMEGFRVYLSHSPIV